MAQKLLIKLKAGCEAADFLGIDTVIVNFTTQKWYDDIQSVMERVGWGGPRPSSQAAPRGACAL